MPFDASAPRVSVLMPTFKQAAFIRRAIESLLAQTFSGWELVIVDDGSPDETGAIVQPFLLDDRIRYKRLPRNTGLGAALNHATDLARGRYIAYLPSDDVYYPDHLQRLVALLDDQPDIFLAYGGVRWNYSAYGATLRGDEVVGREREALADPPPITRQSVLPSGNILALVQVLHRRDHADLRWPARSEIVSDTLEPDRWRALLERGARFAHSGAISCEWVAHPDQHHNIVAGVANGLGRYRQWYGVGGDKLLNFQPSRGFCLDERSRYRGLRAQRDLPSADGLRILLVGELGFNPERIIALEERGHKLYGLWMTHPEPWDTVGPLPFGNIEDIPYGPDWIDRARGLQPDIIYALLNWQALPLIDELFAARLPFPIVFHWKEGPFICQELGLWPALVRALTESDGQIFISAENRDWFDQALGGSLDRDRTLIIDGDLPKADWLTDDWQPKLSDLDGEIHTVCAGRPLGLDPFDTIAEQRIHVHFYGRHFQQQFPNWTRNGLATGYMHLHPTVDPQDWVRELSRYDAAWFHVIDSRNGGELRAANWDDLNLPARLGTYAAAGLPWILKNNAPSIVAIERLARELDVGVLFHDHADLAAQLRDRDRLRRLTANMREHRHRFAFDTYADELIAFFRHAIARHG